MQNLASIFPLGVTLTLIEDTSPVREMFLNQRRQNLRFERDPFFCEDFLDSFEELCARDCLSFPRIANPRPHIDCEVVG